MHRFIKKMIKTIFVFLISIENRSIGHPSVNSFYFYTYIIITNIKLSKSTLEA